MTRKLNAQFLAIMAAQAAAATKVTPSLEADATTDPTEGNAPDTTEHDKAAEDAHAEAAAAPADAAAAPVADPAAVATPDAPAATDAPADAAAPPAADPAADAAAGPDAAAGDTPVEPAAAVTDPIGADLTAAGTPDPVTDTDPADVPTDPVADTVAGADAGTPPPDALQADAGQGSEPQKIVIDVNVNVNGGGDAPAADPVEDAAAAIVEPTDGVTAEDPVVAPDAAVNPAAADAPADPAATDAAVVATEPVAEPVADAAANPVIDETSGVDTTMVDANILSEEELNVMMPTTEDVDGVKVVDETAVEIEVLEGEIGQYEAGHTAMKSMTEVLDTAAENGGTDEAGAKILSIAIEHICEQLQLPQSTLGIPSMESFKMPGSGRVSATTLAMEDLKETAAKVWAAIQAGYAKVMEWLGNFFKHVLDGNQRLATRAQQIQTSVKSVGDQVLNETFDNPGIAKKLAAGQKVSPQIPQSLLALNKFAAAAATGAPGMFQKLAPMVQALTDSVGKEGTSMDQVQEMVSKIAAVGAEFTASLASAGGLKQAGANAGTTFGIGAPAANLDLYLSATWLGNKVVYAMVPNDGKNGYKTGQATADVGEVNGTLPVLPPKTIGDIAYLVLEYTKVAASSQGVWAGMQELYKTAMAGVGVVNSNAAMTGQGAAEKFRALTAVVKDARAMCVGIQQPALAIAAAANSAALDYAAISLKTLGAKAAGEVAAAKAKQTPAAPAAAAAPAAPAAAAPAAA
jgi:hypothetical protein